MNQKIPTVLTIGKATQDVFLRSDEFDPHNEGKMVYTHLPLGVKMPVEDVTFATGGNATNVAVTIARSGLQAKYMWSLGHDPASSSVLQELDAEGVDTSAVVQDDAFQAGYSTILIATNGERTILNHKGKSVGASGKPLDLSQIAGADWVYPSSLADGGLGLMTTIIHTAKKHNTKVMLNPAGPELADVQTLRGLLADVDILCLNKEEMQLLCDGDSIEELVRRGTRLCPVVIVSDGPRGVCASDGKTMITAGMYEDVKVVDRTGAGDAFASGFLSRWAQGAPLRESLIFASANSTSVVSTLGAKAGILGRDAVLHDMPLQTTTL